MASDPSTRASASRGRPRDPAVDHAILEATLELLTEHGYAGLRVGDVAARAGSGLGALYRRWPTKRDLVFAALQTAVPDAGVPVTEDPRADVLAGLQALAAGTAGRPGRLLSGLMSEAASDPTLAQAVGELLIEPQRRSASERLRRVVGEVDDLQLRADVGPAVLFLRGLILRDPLLPEEVEAQLLPLVLGERDRG